MPVSGSHSWITAVFPYRRHGIYTAHVVYLLISSLLLIFAFIFQHTFVLGYETNYN